PSCSRLFFTDSGITSSSGEAVQFIRDAAGRVTTIVAPDGTRVVYTYDGQGSLLSVHNTTTRQNSRYGYSADDSHLLLIATAPAPQIGNAIQYGATAIAKPLIADL